MKVFPGLMAGFVEMVMMVFLATSMALPPLGWLVRKFLPAPGEG